MPGIPRVGVASIVQETNTFSVETTTIDHFLLQGIQRGSELLSLSGSNTEAAGALGALERRGVTAAPLLKAWAMSGGTLADDALESLCDRLEDELRRAQPLDGLVLSLHGALVAESSDSADTVLVARARDVLGEHVPIGVCLDLHANVDGPLLELATLAIGYRTYPHVDQAETGARTAQLVVDVLEGRIDPSTSLAKRPMLTAPEAQGPEGPLGVLRAQADRLAQEHGLLDVSLFPVQPWLDVPGLGFGVTVMGSTADGAAVAERLAGEAWARRRDFEVELVTPAHAIERARRHPSRPLLLSESADSPTAGSSGDSPAVVRALLEQGGDLRAYATLVDRPAVARCHESGPGRAVSVEVGASIDTRFHAPVTLQGRIETVGDGPYALTGPVFTGMPVTMGRWARVEAGRLSVLLTELPACTFDPETYRHVGLEPRVADVVAVRSANLFRAGWGGLAEGALILDLPGASTPRLSTLPYTRVTRPLYPLDDC